MQIRGLNNDNRFACTSAPNRRSWKDGSRTYWITLLQLWYSDDYVKDIKSAGIDMAVMVSFAPDNQLKNNNFWTVAITRPGKNKPAKYPMLIPFISVSPTMKGRTMIEELEHKYKWGMKGLKFHPVAQEFAPDDERMWPVYEWMTKHDLPITAHSGFNVDGKSMFGESERWIPVLE